MTPHSPNYHRGVFEKDDLQTFSYEGCVMEAQTDEDLQAVELLLIMGRGNLPSRLLTRTATGQMRRSRIRGVCWRILLGTVSVNLDSVVKTGDWFDYRHARFAYKDVPLPEGATSTTDNLGVLDQWEKEVQRHRDAYTKLHKELLVDPASNGGDDEEVDLAVNNPLSDAAESPWQKYFKKNDYQKTIKQDIERLHSENDFFRNAIVRTVIEDVLLVWCMSNENIGYRQGMHEILALLLLVLARDVQLRFDERDNKKESEGETSQSFGQATSVDSGEALPPSEGSDQTLNSPSAGGNKLGKHVVAPERLARAEEFLDFLLDPKFLAADCYELFDKLMRKFGLQDWYEQKASYGTRPVMGEVKAIPADAAELKAMEEAKQKDQTAIVRECTRLQNVLLKKADVPVQRHLDALGIEAQVYALKWLRLLFLREFQLEDVMLLWDFIFSDLALHDAKVDNLVPHISVAMLKFMRDNILGQDYSMVIKRLLKFPPYNDIQTFIQSAVALRYPGDQLLQKVLAEPPPRVDLPTPPPDIVTTNPAPAGTPVTAAAAAAGGAAAGGGGGPAAAVAAVSGNTHGYTNAAVVRKPQPKSEEDRRAQALQKEIENLNDRQIRMGQRLEKIIEVMQTRWFGIPDMPEGDSSSSSEAVAQRKASIDEQYLIAIAEMKKVKDILIGRITEDDVE